jgi:hypothetical protein
MIMIQKNSKAKKVANEILRGKSEKLSSPMKDMKEKKLKNVRKEGY